MYAWLDLSRWIDLTTGEIKNGQTDVSREGFLEEVYRQGVDTLLSNHLLRGSDPFVLPDESELCIELSEKIITKTAMVYPGIGAKVLREHSSCREEIGEFPGVDLIVDTREQQKEHSYILLGEFRASRGKYKIGTIILYTKAMSDYANRKTLDFESVFWPSLAHEVFYAFHYGMLQRGGKADRWRCRLANNKDRDLVVNSLAEFFEFCFRAHHPYINEADAMIKKWKRLDIDGWPASGALGIEESARPDDLFGYLFELSFYDWKTAADIIRTGYYLCSQEIRRKLRV